MNVGLKFVVIIGVMSLVAACRDAAPIASDDHTDLTPHKLWVSTVKYQDPASEIYLGSPSLIRLDNDQLLASHDYFGPNRPHDELGRSNRTTVYLSTDKGLNWKRLKDIDGIYWATLFMHRGDVYLLGTSAANASVAILKSTDNGKSWTTPTDGNTGRLFEEGSGGNAPRYHCAPTPVLEHNGKLYKGFENVADNTLPGMRGYTAFVISIDIEKDLLQASNWTKSNELSFDGSWDPLGSNPTTGWLEGNAVAGPDGTLWNILRVNSTPFHSRSAMIKIDDDGAKASFTPDNFITFPGGQCKFVIRQDPTTKLYWAMLNATPDVATQRNILELHVSKNLKNWYFAKTLMADNQGYSKEKSIELTGFQYPDWQFDGDDLIYLSRTAYGQNVPRAHDANRITFGRVEDYKEYTPSVLK